MLGQWLSDPDHPAVLTRETWLNEEVLGLLPDTTVTVNNVGWFAANYFMVLEPVAQLGVLPMPLGDGDVKKDAPPSNEDIAAVNVAALTDPAAHAGKVYRPTGPKLLSPNEIAAIMGTALGRRVKYQNISEAMLLKALKVQGFPEAMPTQLRLYAAEYRRGAFAVHAPNTVVSDLTGRRPDDFEAIARRVVATHPDAVRGVAKKLTAMRNFMKILLTAKIDADAIERRRDHVLLKAPTFVADSQGWRAGHDPDAGYMPDRPEPLADGASQVRSVTA